jgi:hypothetical protein
MFPLGLAAFIDRQWANNGGWGIFAACIAVYLVHGLVLFPLANFAHDTSSVWRPCDSAHQQCFGMPGDD